MSARLLGHHHAHHCSAVHRFPAEFKLGVGLAVILGTVLLPAMAAEWFVAVGALLLLTMLVSGIAPGFLLKRLLALSPLVLGVALVNALQPAGRATWLGVALKSVFCLLTVLIVSNTTPLSEVLRVLRRARVPALLITTIALMHRYLFVLADEAERMRRGRAGRTFVRTRGFHWRTLATVVGQLFIRASERAERIYDAMCARGWR